MPVSSIIDIGTNTIHLLIAKHSGKSYRYILREKQPARLGEGGTANNLISPEAMERGISTLKKFKLLSEQHRSNEIMAFATAMVRNSINGKEFVEQVKAETGIKIEIISGNKEADLIMRGIRSSLPEGLYDFLVMDIGGGSTEFIYSKNDQIKWKESFQFGVTSLLEKFITTDPISRTEQEMLEAFIHNSFSSLWEHVPKECTLIGASGSFDSLSEMIAHSNDSYFSEDETFEFSVNEFNAIHDHLIDLKSSERKNIKGLVDYRVNTIIPSVVLLNTVLKNLKISRIIRSPYALKEGAFLAHFID